MAQCKPPSKYLLMRKFFILDLRELYTANEGPVRIQYKCLVPIYVFHIHVSVSDLYISTIGLLKIDLGNIEIAQRYVHELETGSEAVQIHFISGNICFKFSLQCNQK